MSRTEIFDVQKEINELKRRIKYLEENQNISQPPQPTWVPNHESVFGKPWSAVNTEDFYNSHPEIKYFLNINKKDNT